MSKRPQVLCLQTGTSMRGFKSAKILTELGYDVTVAYHGIGDSGRFAKFSDFNKIDMSEPGHTDKMRWGLIRSRELRSVFGDEKGKMFTGHLISIFPNGLKPFLKWIRKEYDLQMVQVMGYPDGPILPAKKVLNKPTIFDFRDLSTGHTVESFKGNYANPVMQMLGLDTRLARWNKDLWEKHEACVAEIADGVIYSSEAMAGHLKKKHKKIRKKSSVIMENRPFAEDVPKKLPKKLSEEDGKPHFCFIGGLSLSRYRDCRKIFKKICRQDVQFHIYLSSSKDIVDAYKKALKGYDNAIFHEPLSPKDLYGTIGKYDYGVIPFATNIDVMHVNYGIGNKIFEYLSCGLRLASTPLTAIELIINKDKVGFTFQDKKELTSRLKKDWAARDSQSFDRFNYTMDVQIPAMKKFYNQTFKDYN